MNKRATKLSLLMMLVIVAVTGSIRPILGQPSPTPSASGHGNFRVSSLDLKQTFSFHATKHRDGTVTGYVEFHHQKGTDVLKIHAQIDCLRVEGNRAIMSGTLTNSNNPAYEGRGIYVIVEDNGEGSNDPPDRIQAVFTPAGSPIECGVNLVMFLIPIEEGGNIQVRSQ